MTRPCSLHTIDPHTTLRDGCDICRLYQLSPKIREIWDKPESIPSRHDPKAEAVFSGEKVGTALKTLLLELGAEKGEECGCDDLARLMDKWGIEGCTKHREKILTWLRAQQRQKGWGKTAKVGTNVVRQMGIVTAFTAALDPAAWLLDEAIRRVQKI